MLLMALLARPALPSECSCTAHEQPHPLSQVLQTRLSTQIVPNVFLHVDQTPEAFPSLSSFSSRSHPIFAILDMDGQLVYRQQDIWLTAPKWVNATTVAAIGSRIKPETDISKLANSGSHTPCPRPSPRTCLIPIPIANPRPRPRPHSHTHPCPRPKAQDRAGRRTIPGGMGGEWRFQEATKALSEHAGSPERWGGGCNHNSQSPRSKPQKQNRNWTQNRNPKGNMNHPHPGQGHTPPPPPVSSEHPCPANRTRSCCGPSQDRGRMTSSS